eukprot:scaffold12.g8077.t1
MLADTMARASAELAKVAAALRLLVNDAGTYDAADPGSAGGVDGSVVLPEELGRPENAGLKPLVERLAKAKAAIDSQQAARGAAPFSWADTIALAAKARPLLFLACAARRGGWGAGGLMTGSERWGWSRAGPAAGGGAEAACAALPAPRPPLPQVTTEAAWVQQRQARASTPEGKKNALMFSNPIPLRIGRVDAAAPTPAGRLPPRGAAVAEVKAFFSKLGVKPGADEGPFAKKPPFSERVHFLLWSAAQEDQAAAEAALVEADPGAYADWKKKAIVLICCDAMFSSLQYDISRRTVTRTDYEVDFGEKLSLLADLGATFDKKAYLYPLTFALPVKL